ncbi:hypothetical protein [Streptomyces sp. NK08204]|uniref:hypothetical protein n=1 Tax=Streptomyces sp. NK08204 TaxID=2873260 RepID=UPI001CEDC4F5|nr:hypothetical protein [Streptomyces sp. NK08204]
MDITGYTLVRDDSGNIAISSGIRDEGSQTEPSTASLELGNGDGRFSPRNPSGPYYGMIGRNTPFRVSVPDGMGGKSYRLWGEASEWAPGWDTSGSDVWTDVSVSGVLRRLAQAPAPERSVIYTAITDPQPTGLVAYWPCEDPTGSVSLASALATGSAMHWSGIPTLASYSGFAASDPLPDLTTATMSGGVPKYDDPTASQVRFLACIPADGLSDGKVLCAIDQVDYGGAKFWELYYDATSRSLVLRQHNLDGSLMGVTLPHTLDVRGRLLYVSVELQENGTGTDRAVRLVDVNTRTVYSVTDTTASTQLTRVTRVQFGPASRSVVGPVGAAYLPGVAVGHVTVENQITAVDALGVRINPIGETAGRRVQRLCAEQGLGFEWIGDLDDTAAMGAQARSNLLSLVQECALADGGMLYETRSGLGLGYRTRSSLYNQDPVLTLDYAAGQLRGDQVPVPVEDDRYLQNKVTITVNGVSQTYEDTSSTLSTQPPPAGVGEYGQEYTLNLASTDTDTLLDQAAWRVHLGTVDEARYPQIGVNLAHSSITPDMRRAVIGMRIGDRIQIVNPPAWLPPDVIDQLVLGMSETITRFEHRVTFTCAPASPYTVGYLDSAAARVDTDGSQLLSAIGSSDTILYVAPSPGMSTLWTTDSAETPWDIRVGGEVMRVTAVTPSVRDTFSRTTSNGWGTADTGQPWSVTGSAADFAVGSGYGSVTQPSTGIAHLTTIAASSADTDLYADVATSALATGASLFGGPVIRAVDNNNWYMARVEFTTANTIVLSLRKRVSGVETELAAITTALTHVAGAFYRVRIQAVGAALKARIWTATDTEPGSWHVMATDSSLTSSATVGTRSFSGAGNTNVSPQLRFANFQLISPQTFTVVRSVNGVVKAQQAGSDVRLAHPTILAL